MNNEIEKAVLCMVFNDENLLLQYGLNERDFVNPLHKKIFNLIKLFWNNLEFLQGKLNQEEYDYFMEVISMLVSYNNIKADYDELKRLTEMRRLKEVNHQVQLALDSDSPMSNVLEKIQMFEKQEVKETNIEESLKRIVGVLNGDIVPVVYPTQYKELDHYLWWWFTPGQFVVLAWRPSRWKTMLATCLMLNMLKAWYSTAYFSLEMTIDQMTERILANHSWIAVAKMKQKTDDVETFSRIGESINKVYEWLPRLSIVDWMDNGNEIIREIKYLVKTKNVQIVFIDYLQIMDWVWESRQYVIAKITRSLKMAAIQLWIVIVCLSQLSRSLENRADTAPKLSDLRDSWSIEQDADVVLMIERDIDEGSRDLKIYIRKNRNWSCWEFNLECLPASMQVWNPKKPF